MSLHSILSDRKRFISRLKFEDASANLISFKNPFREQIALVEAYNDPDVKTIVVLKPRQIGISTVNCADTFFETFTARKPLRSLIVADHSKTTKSLFQKFLTFKDNLPKPLRDSNPFRVNRVDKTLVSTRTGALIDHMTARGDTHGRGWTYQRLIAEELAFWQHPEDVWAGLRSTLHDGPDTKIIIISTPNGPGDFYHGRCMAAIEAERQGDKSIRFVFSKWSDHDVYRKSPPDKWEPSEEEYQLMRQHNLDMPQIYWRHEMIYGVEGIGERRFRREYPLTIEDGFLVLEGAWFDVDYLNECLNELPNEVHGELRIYIEPEMDVDYVIGCDPSWCTGGDYAVACVMNEYGEQCAVLSCKEGGEDLFAEKLNDLSRYYRGARVLTEANTGGAGRVVIKQLLRENTPIWRSPKGADWITHRGNKEMAYSFARQMVNSDAFELRDHQTIQELMHVREKKNRIEGQDGYHDDHADAFVLACWALRTCPGFGRDKEIRIRSRNITNPMTRIARALR